MSPVPHNYRSYQTVNIVFFVLLPLVFVYAALFSPDNSHYPIPSFYNRYMSEQSPTTGLSHSFSAIVRGNLHDAKNLNPYGIRIFLFFFLEWIFRTVAFFSLKKEWIPYTKLLQADILASTILFTCCFGRLLLFWNYL
ncbi:MAG TPA: hypothetical protein ENK25_02865 [Bacteroidetes bacterium]|nr:hypothetical protein [Bacteroidota bacterium]